MVTSSPFVNDSEIAVAVLKVEVAKIPGKIRFASDSAPEITERRRERFFPG